ncbi:MAG: carbamoyltransferase HypF [Bacteroidales bacterium]|jgi:hydrogenase maturation protein HypF|nr:carbamoyltransferase HypF [Bacteroidales bacterium]MDD4213564.1 carbamoyltransferase HypF [Bacteroidales bacterium]
MNTYTIKIKGLVQGVGFRPFVYRLAKQYNLSGSVENRNDGVCIKINCNEFTLNNIVKELKNNAPQASQIDVISVAESQFKDFNDFTILKSRSISDEITDISPDIAVCGECLKDMTKQANRIDYPFINCTNCGPRFTIIQNIPYDREKTTMRPFDMCPQCRKEYTDILDRRFHAQPVACSICGPEYTLHIGNEKVNGINEILSKLSDLILSKKIVAIKGMGGYFIACDAQCEETVARLRKLKNREGKPFAVMFSTIDTLHDFAFVNEHEKKVLLSFRRPVVLLKQKKNLASSVNVGFDTLGCILPYMPVHYLLFQHLPIPAIVLTSGNISDEPIITNDDEALEKLNCITDATLTYNREIYNRNDDSVVFVTNNQERIIRRSRGYVPRPINTNHYLEGILAAGAELTNCFAIGKGNKAILSQHIGDLKNFETYEFYCETMERFRKLFLFEPKVVTCDLHSNYLSTKYAKETKLPLIQVQHHHAHIVACMAENVIDEKVIGIAMDGTGYGEDGNIWGSEFLICDLNNFKRYTHFDYMPMPGGDKATEEPWRMAVSYLHSYFGKEFLYYELEFLKNIDTNSVEMVCEAINKKINCPLSSGSGRLFDAVAALINICTHSKFHAEAPMRLESIIDSNCRDSYSFSINKTIVFKDTFLQIIEDLKQKISPSVISAKFHNTIVNIVLETVIKIRNDLGINRIALSGGTFQNKFLSENIENKLAASGFEVFIHTKVPSNDGGIALGQIVVAANRLKQINPF